MSEAVGPKSNRFAFGFGTIGRDMVYSMISMFLIVYLTEVMQVSDRTLWWITGIILACRVFDACNDPVMGVIVDNTQSRWGKFKPWMLVGAVISGVLTVALFSGWLPEGAGFIPVFGVLYLLWGISFTMNDISYWSMLPALSVDQKEREKIGSMARIFANIGLFTVVAGIVPLTGLLSGPLGGELPAWAVFAIGVVVIMWGGQAVTLLKVKQPSIATKQTHTRFRDLLKVIFKNDQLLFTAISMALFMIGYTTTTSFGVYYFKYVYGDEGMYSVFAVVLGVSQLAALTVFPLVSKKFPRGKIFNFSMILVAVGYVVFFFAPTNTMTFIAIAGLLLFVGQAWIQIMMLMFLADSVDYGHWKLGARNDSITFSLQPFVNKMGGAISSGVVGATAILSGINQAKSSADMTPDGLLMIKAAMLVLPLICILASYLIYRAKYRIDEATYTGILADLRARGEIS